MTNTKELFDKNEGEFLKFDLIEHQRSGRRDMHAFMLLDELDPDGGANIIGAAEHDEIWIDVSPHTLDCLTEPQIIELVRCGVMFDDDTESLHMYA